MKILKSIKTRIKIIGNILKFLWHRKLWWLIPFVVVLMLFAILIIFAQITGLGPFIYTLF